MKRKVCCVLLVCLLAGLMPLQALAAGVNVIANGTPVAGGFLQDGTTLVPLREIAKILGLEIGWDPGTNTATLAGKTDTPPATVVTQAAPLGEQEKALLKVIDDNRSGIINISKTIWNLKEKSTQEFKSAALLEDALEQAGFAVTRGLKGIDPFDDQECDIPTGFVATYQKTEGGPTIGIMLEYDALPMGHACGHNLIAASGYAAALALKAALEEENIPGQLVVLGTPAEEWGGPGKTQMLKGGHFEGIDAVLITHPADRWDTSSEVLAIAWPRGEVMTFKGKAAHASADPEKGRSALDAAMLFGLGVDLLREHMVDSSRIHYCIMDGGQAPNVVPDHVTMDVYVRAKDTAYLYELMGRVDNIAKAATLATDTTVEYQWDYPWFAGVPVPKLYDHVQQTAVALGVPEQGFKKTSALGSSDFGNVGYEIPTVNLDFPIAPEGTPGHSEAFMNAAASDFGQESMLQAAKVIAVSGYRLFTDAALLSEIKAEFKQNKK